MLELAGLAFDTTPLGKLKYIELKKLPKNACWDIYIKIKGFNRGRVVKKNTIGASTMSR